VDIITRLQGECVNIQVAYADTNMNSVHKTYKFFYNASIL